MAEISKKRVNDLVKNMGIPESDLIKTLTLVRNLRIRTVAEKLDPRATRIALIYAERVDRYFAQKRLKPEEMTKLREIAIELVEEQVQRFESTTKGKAVAAG